MNIDCLQIDHLHCLRNDMIIDCLQIDYLHCLRNDMIIGLLTVCKLTTVSAY